MSIKGKKVAILESRLGRQLVELVEGRGGVAFHAPALAELPDLDPDAIAALVRSLEERPAKLAIFQTGVGTRALFAATDSLGATTRLTELLSRMAVAVRGPKPSAALRARGVRIDRYAADPFTTKELLESIRDLALEGERVIVQRHGAANVELDRALEGRGAAVVEIPTYRWALPADTAPLEALIGALERAELDAVVLTNAEQVRNLFAVAGAGRAERLRAALNRTLVASIGPVASAALRDAGIRVSLEASPPKLGALMTALDQALS
ncbi:MAG TPA: uroporphyrinogen-III synthase [Burkholderiales bacterium]|jgi:uroporphyrinogen-III synthase|nr:uroporphyrinogen-III synthase [Burkholderiales bacterium]